MTLDELKFPWCIGERLYLMVLVELFEIILHA